MERVPTKRAAKALIMTACLARAEAPAAPSAEQRMIRHDSFGTAAVIIWLASATARRGAGV